MQGESRICHVIMRELGKSLTGNGRASDFQLSCVETVNFVRTKSTRNTKLRRCPSSTADNWESQALPLLVRSQDLCVCCKAENHMPHFRHPSPTLNLQYIMPRGHCGTGRAKCQPSCAAYVGMLSERLRRFLSLRIS